MLKLLILLLSLSLALTSCVTATKKEPTSEKEVEMDGKVEAASPNEENNFILIEGSEAVLQTALMAAPKESRDSCKVLGYDKNGEVVTLREGSNEFIALADNPKKEGFSAACYHISLEPFMARGRALKAEGKGREEIFKIRGEEIESGKLTMGNAGSTLHIYHGPDAEYDPETGAVKEANYRYVVYLPYATPQSTGLPIQPLASNHPWIMDPGTHRAHIMITPKPRED